MAWDLPVPVIATAVGSFFGFLTALAGFWLNAWLTWKRQQEAIQLQSANVRTLIACEIDHNLQTLKTYLDGLDSLWSNSYGTEVPRVVFVQPQYSQDAYRSQMSAIPLALSQDEIRAVIKLYSDLESLDREDELKWQTVVNMRETLNPELGLQGWKTNMKLFRDLLNQGNPLKPEQGEIDSGG
jgi:hypothetical protein